MNRRPADHEIVDGIDGDMGFSIRPDGFPGKGGQDDRLPDIIVQPLGAHLVVHGLGAAHHQGEAVNPVGAPVPVFHPHLGFTVQGEIGD